MIPSSTEILTKLSLIRDFGAYTEQGETKRTARSGAVHLEVLGDAQSPSEVNLMFAPSENETEHVQNVAIAIQLLNLTSDDDASTWLTQAISSEEKQPYIANGNIATIINPIESIVVLNVKALPQVAVGNPEELIEEAVEISQDARTETILEPLIDETDLDLLRTMEISVEQLQGIKLFLAEALLTEPSFNMGTIDLSESMSTMQQASKQTDPNLTVLLTSMASLMSASEVQKATHAALSEQIALKDQAIAQALTILEQILPS